MKFYLSCIVSLLIVCGCKEVASENPVAADTESVAPEATEIMSNAESKLVDNKQDRIAPKIIRQAELEFETPDLDTTYQRLQQSVKKYHAVIGEDKQGKEYNRVYRDITVRVPSTAFDQFIEGISEGIGYFDHRDISARDVTAEYLDVDARLNAKNKLEARYLELLKKATKVSEMLEIETQLSAIREDIEAKQAQLKYLQQQVSMSTVNIRFYKTVAQENGITVSYGTKIGNALKSGFNGFSSFFIVLLQLWPFIIILVAVIYVVRKRIKKKRIKNV